MDNEKRIAYIFREEKVFLTKDGRFFGFVYDGQSVKCRKLSEKEKFCFLHYHLLPLCYFQLV